MKLKIKDDMTSTFVKTLNQAAMYCNISEKSYSYPISVINIKTLNVNNSRTILSILLSLFGL